MLLPASVSTVLVHTSLYTLYLVFQCASLYALAERKKAPKPITTPILLIFSLTLFVLISTQWALTIADTFEFLEATRYMSLMQIKDEAPLLYTGHHKDAKLALHWVQTLLGNSFFAYRLYIVYRRRIVVLIVPTILILAPFAFGILVLVPSVNFPFLPMLVSSVMANLIITVMIAVKVWNMDRASSLIKRTVCTVFDSAGLYTFVVILSLASIFISGDSFSSFLSMQGPIIGISVCSIVLLDLSRSDPQMTPLLHHDEGASSIGQVESQVDVTE